MRLFVAVTLPDDLKARLGAVQEQLRPAQADVSWVRPANLHATLKFLGEVEPKRVERLRGALVEVVRAVAPFRIRLGGVGTFGRPPRVVWVGVGDGAGPLTELAERVETALGQVGFPKERRGFSAHLTLGRVRSGKNLERLLQAIADVPPGDMGETAVDAIALMQSELNPAGSIYTELDRCPLRTV
jgi:RNA 2',3'-cyclic 3'-phosphodiesterase